MNVMDQLCADYGHLTKMHQKIADFITNNLLTTSFMTIKQLADTIGTSTTTIIRLANSLGYAGYSDFQAALQEIIIDRPPSHLLGGLENRDENADCTVSSIAERQLMNIHQTFKSISANAVTAAAHVLLDSNYIYTVGDRGSYSASYLLSRNLGRLLGKCDLLESNSGNLAEKILRIRENDVLVAFSMPRYLNNALSVVSCAKSQGARIISVTGETSPLSKYSDILISIASQSGSSFRSIIPSILFVEMLVDMVGQLCKGAAQERLKKIEALENDKKLGL